jgi:hypothetical protein
MARTNIFKKVLIATGIIVLMFIALMLMVWFRTNNVSMGSGLILVIAFLGVLMTPKTAHP